MSAVLKAPPLQQRVFWVDRLSHLALLFTVALLGLGLVAPLLFILSKALEQPEGATPGTSAFVAYLSSPALLQSLWHSVWVSVLVMVIVVPLAFAFAYALTRSRMPLKGLFYAAALLPVFAPSLLSAISLVYIFGNQGLVRQVLFGQSIYGPIGIVLAEVFYTFPHALLVLVTALALATDGSTKSRRPSAPRRGACSGP